MPAAPIAETRYIGRGFAAGIVGGLSAFVFTKVFAETQIQAGIDYESARDEAQHLLDKAAGLPVVHEGHEIFTRGVQGGVGAGVGLIFFGIALGGIFSVVFILASRRWPSVSPRTMAVLVAVALFAGLYLIPSLKYPSNPPAIGHEDTIKQRSELFLVMVIVSVLSVGTAIVTAGKLSARFGSWNGTLLAAFGLAVFLGVVFAIMPPVGHLASNVAEFGRHGSETPLPLRDGSGTIVFPGFPADVLAQFRLYAVLNQAIMWLTLGLVYGALVQRMVSAVAAKDRRATASASPAAVA